MDGMVVYKKIPSIRITIRFITNLCHNSRDTDEEVNYHEISRTTEGEGISNGSGCNSALDGMFVSPPPTAMPPLDEYKRTTTR